VKTGSKLAESSKEDYGSKRAVLPMMMIDIFDLIFLCDTDKDI
jgi:hypothetical protein